MQLLMRILMKAMFVSSMYSLSPLRRGSSHLVRSVRSARATMISSSVKADGTSSSLSSSSSTSSAPSLDPSTTPAATATADVKASIGKYVASVRALMKKDGIDALIIPTDDPHMSEYTAPYFGRREFISGFTGSAGTVIITRDESVLFTDGRYHKQAEIELPVDWLLMKQGLKDVPTPIAYLTQSLSAGAVVGVDPLVHAAQPFRAIESKLQAKSISVKSMLADAHPVDIVWAAVTPKLGGEGTKIGKSAATATATARAMDAAVECAGGAGETLADAVRPPMPSALLRVHPLQYAGKSVKEKFIDVRQRLVQQQARALVVSSLDEVAWLLNVRGADVPCNPVSVAYAVLTLEDAHLFIDEKKVPPEVREGLARNGVVFHKYDEIVAFLTELDKKINKDKDEMAIAQPKRGRIEGEGEANLDDLRDCDKVWFDGRTNNVALFSAVSEGNRVDRESPITLMKAVKNEAELAGMRACHIRDGAAMAEFLAELEATLAQDVESVVEGEDGSVIRTTVPAAVSEFEIDLRVTEKRAQMDLFLERSFPTIAGVNGNGAIIHYRAPEKGCKDLTRNDMLLLDSGAQYIDGTTDVTRTFHFGQPTDFQREMFTRVLKGNIGVDRRVFPTGTPGCLLDAFAREHLWAAGKNYIHGTGHGVGAALNVHEGPHSISPRLDSHPLIAGNIVSNEPGFYEVDSFGIRIENLLMVVERPDLGEYGGKSFLGFEKLTQIPIQKRLIDTSLLTPVEVLWLNDYHAQIWEKVSPLLKTDLARAWLRESTSPLQESA